MKKFRSILLAVSVIASPLAHGMAQRATTEDEIVITISNVRVQYDDGTSEQLYRGYALYALERKDGLVRVNWVKRGWIDESALIPANEFLPEMTLDWLRKKRNRANLLIHGEAMAARGDYTQALEHYQSALALNEDDEYALNYLAWILATCPDESIRDGNRALECAKKSCELTKWAKSSPIAVLASAYAEVGDFKSAKKYVQKALLMDKSYRKIRIEMLESFKNDRPYRQSDIYVAS